MNYIFYNPTSNSGKNKDVLNKALAKYENYLEVDITNDENYLLTLKKLTSEDEAILVGGDGTLNHFINKIKDFDLPCNVYFYTAGTGNDFYNDVKNETNKDGIVLLNPYLKNLPTVIVNDKEYKFIDGIGYGIDGYCCEEGDKLRLKSDKPVNYTSIAIKGLLFHFKRPNATITVDGVTQKYNRVWLAPTMKGRYYGGGMMVTPNQDRLNKENTVTTAIMYNSGKLHTLMVFPSIFKGEHVKHTKMFKQITGHHIIVEFDRPTALQIDGETFTNITKYEVKA